MPKTVEEEFAEARAAREEHKQEAARLADDRFIAIVRQLMRRHDVNKKTAAAFAGLSRWRLDMLIKEVDQRARERES